MNKALLGLLVFGAIAAWLLWPRQDVCLFLGDSITEGARATPEVVTVKQRFSYAVARHYRCIEINAGISRDTSIGGASRVKNLLNRYDPDRIFIMYGTNDAHYGVSPRDYERRMRSILEASIAQKAEITLMMPPASTHPYTRVRLPIYVNILHGLSKQYPEVRLVDVNRAFSQPEALLMDYWHPNAQGHKVIAAAIMQASRAR